MKKLLFLAAFLMALTQTYAQQGIQFPYTYGIHTYILENQDYVAFYKDCKANGFDYIEVNPGEYGGGSTEEAIYNGSMKTADAMIEAGVYAWSVHLPYGGSSSDISVIDEESRKKVVANLSNYIRALCRAFHPQRLVLHPSAEPVATDERREQHIQSAIKSVSELTAVAKQCGSVLCVENLPRTCLGNTPEELLRIVQPTPDARICFDTNHYLKGDYEEFIRKTGHLISTVHISDYDYSNEKHWIPGLGRLPWGEIVLLLEEYGYKGVFMSESDNGRNGTATPAETKASFDNVMDEYKMVKADPFLRTQKWLDGMAGRYWYGTTVDQAFPAGTAPGFYTSAARARFDSAYEAVTTAIREGKASAEELMALRTAFSTAMYGLFGSVNAMKSGYYYFRNGNDGFVERNKNMAMYSDHTLTLKWKEWEPKLEFIFKVEALENGNFSIRNMSNDAYIYTVDGTSSNVPTSATHQADQLFTSAGRSGLFNIGNVKNTTPYHASGHRDGEGTSGAIVTWSGGAGSSSSWWVVPVNEETVDELLKDKPVSNALTQYLANFSNTQCSGQDYAVVYPQGTDPGFYAPAAFAYFKSQYDSTVEASLKADLSAEEADERIGRLETAFDSLKAAQNPMTEGYYHIVCAHFGFSERQKTMAMYADETNQLKWKALDSDDEAFLFRIVKKRNSKNYLIQNVRHSTFISSQSASSTPVPLSKFGTVGQIIDPLNRYGMMLLSNERVSTRYHAQNHGEGAGESGNIIIWNSNPIDGSASSWFLRRVDYTPTGIAGIKADSQDPDNIYTIDGRKTDRVGKGIHIVNGRKILGK